MSKSTAALTTVSKDTADMSMTQDELNKRKALLEIQNLERANDEILKASKKNLYDLLLKFFTALSGLFLLATGVTGPINKYFHDRQREHDISLSKDIKTILDAKSDSAINLSNIVGVSIEQPKVAAKILLSNFNDGHLKESETMTNTYKYMYEMSKSDWRYLTILDRIANIFQQSDQEILKDELLKYSTDMYKQYISDTTKAELVKRVTSYLWLIKDLGLNTQDDFKKSFDILRSACKGRDDGICKMIN